MFQSDFTSIYRLAYRRSLSDDRRLIERWLSLHFGGAAGDSSDAKAELADADISSQRLDYLRRSLLDIRLESGAFLVDHRCHLMVWNQTLDDLFPEVAFANQAPVPEEVPNEIRRVLLLGCELVTLGATEIEYSFRAEDERGRICFWDVAGIRVEMENTSDVVAAMLLRPVAYQKESALNDRPSLSESLLVFQQLDAIDRQICEAIATGETTGEIATMVGLTRRSVEVRRAKILERLEFTRPVEIVRLLVRLEENDLL
ncbi:LuxR C-terminal-related transcriptional regulator [Rhodopirellula halodulae]|uniref:LuxR C-terminal-related transcriptional regulator n=1 Tax=Rhodopirellula halodulae TaxID=2894198 RepID=UPI001E486A89|nr:LuxR C-terminal-related transcriptional regulator [Rhodopirellula sp. JC737]MCC9658132.1 LuxR C-terminal-related transcriptional regulator [Rhodopirellula sp. JC737]